MIARIRGTAVVVVIASALAACRMQRYEPGAVSLEGSERATAENAVGAAPMFAISTGGERALAWVSAPDSGSDGRLYVSVNGGAPAEIRDSLGPIQAHGEAPPRLAYGPNGWIYAAYTVGKVVPGSRFPLSALRLVHSRNGGREWSKPVTVSNDAVFGAHNFHALHVADDGTVYVSWLGHPTSATTASSGGKAAAGPHIRVSEAMPGMEMSDASGMGGMHHESSAAWIASSTDHGSTFTAPVRVDLGEACPCCRTALASAPDGSLYLAWRHVFPGSVRDIVVSRSTDKGRTWSEPERVHADDWRFEACPHAGPSIAVDSSGAASIAWWTGKPGAAGVYYAKAQKGTTHFAPPIALGVAPYSRPSHVQLGLTPDGDVVVAWDDGTRQVPQVVLRGSADGGRTWGPLTALSPAGQVASFPALAMDGRHFEVAWSQQTPDAAAAKASGAPDMKDPKAVMGLEKIGATQVFTRRGVLQ